MKHETILSLSDLAAAILTVTCWRVIQIVLVQRLMDHSSVYLQGATRSQSQKYLSSHLSAEKSPIINRWLLRIFETGLKDTYAMLDMRRRNPATEHTYARHASR